MHEKRTKDLEAIDKTSKAWVDDEEASGILKVRAKGPFRTTVIKVS
ncbi:MAG: hypothetical protein U5Q03_19775 [Bacteroidota bacterium]|nr:hypothetical protein [Bacteroidota bacterium]